MHPSIEHLLVVQDRDKKIAHLKLELQHIPAEEKQIDEKLKRQSSQFEALKEKARQTESARKRLELEVQSKQSSIERFKQQMSQTKKNDEYQALNHEIERFGADISLIEDEELKLMEEYEDLKKQIAVEEKNVKAFEQQASVQKADLKKKEEAIRTQLAETEEKRKTEAAQVDASHLSKYERILVSKKDVAIVPLLHGNTCGGCHMKVTPTTIHAAKTGHDLVQCEICARFVYFAEE